MAPSTTNNTSETSRPPTPAPATAIPTQSRRTPPKLTTPEIIALNNEVINATTGKAYLERIALAISGKPYTIDAISEILLHTTQLTSISLPAQTAIHAVAFVLKEVVTDETTEIIARHVTAAISPHIAKLQDTEEKLMKLSTDINATLASQSLQLEKIQMTVDTLSKQATESANSKPSYAAAVMTSQGQQPETETQAHRLQLIAREAIKERQIMIGFTSNSPLAAGNSSHAQLIERVKTALKNLATNDESPKLDINPGTKDELVRNLDPDATFKERSYPLIVPFTPVSYNPTDVESTRQLESENGWNNGTILSTHWVKLAEKRSSSQKVAHLMITFTEPQTANLAIHDGITIDHLLLWPKKNRHKPLRCAKCQHFGHIARECIAHGDTCANCGNNH
ncbi:uncharacterized protein BJ212DRAFT_1542147 [Suillus subaureus]|uniref:CCHC-type domain-containing protein n=1 Tax=Suillus subaureus TaxID=48587 RepID=A0A9P7DXE7_9AGAM|nr:uncharacterized protein BJ212DRAFT_1542147 [Suillus subaureus]KAG1805659.1 hypothetical protein BJ212DRAFT_1542147 [Suillus subaureus]